MDIFIKLTPLILTIIAIVVLCIIVWSERIKAEKKALKESNIKIIFNTGFDQTSYILESIKEDVEDMQGYIIIGGLSIRVYIMVRNNKTISTVEKIKSIIPVEALKEIEIIQVKSVE